MLVEKTIHQGLRVLGDIYGVNEELTGTLEVALTLDVGGKITGAANLEIGTTSWLKGDTTIGITPTNTTTLTVYGLITIPAGGYTTGLVIEKALDMNIGGTAFDVDNELFKFSDGTNVVEALAATGIRLDSTVVGIGALGVTGTQLYVHDKAVTGQLATFHSEFSGPAKVDIDARISNDPRRSLSLIQMELSRLGIPCDFRLRVHRFYRLILL